MNNPDKRAEALAGIHAAGKRLRLMSRIADLELRTATLTHELAHVDEEIDALAKQLAELQPQVNCRSAID